MPPTPLAVFPTTRATTLWGAGRVASLGLIPHRARWPTPTQQRMTRISIAQERSDGRALLFNHLTTRPRRNQAPRTKLYVVPHEAHAAVAEKDVYAAGVSPAELINPFCCCTFMQSHAPAAFGGK